MAPTDKVKIRHVYVIGTPSGPFKIGVATNLRDRLSSIQTGSHLRMAALHAVVVPASHACAVESHAHKQLKPFWISGEWFNVSVDQAKAAIILAVSWIEDEERREIKDRAEKLRQLELARLGALEFAKRAEERRKYDARLKRFKADLESWILEAMAEFTESAIPYRPRAPIHNGSTEPPPDSVDNL